MTELDLSKQDSPQVAPRAGTMPGLTGQAPLPVGRPMTVTSPSPGERKVLEEAGWQEGDVVPENFHEVREAALASATNLDNMPPPGDLSTPPLTVPAEQDISDLPLDKQKEVQDLLQASLIAAQGEQQAAADLQNSLVEGAGGGINDAIQLSSQVDLSVSDDTASDTYASGVPKSQDIKKDAEPKGALAPMPNCPRCDFPLHLEETVEVTESDKLNFLQALLGLTQFKKTYHLYGGNLIISLRSLTPEEVDTCFRQVFSDAAHGRVATRSDEHENLVRYRTVLQIVSMQGDNLDLKLPGSLAEWVDSLSPEKRKELEKEDDTPMVSIWSRFMDKINHSESIHRTLLSAVGNFNQLVNKLEANKDTEDFWKATDTPT